MVNKKQEILLQHTIKDGPSIKLDDQGKIVMTSKNKKNILTVDDDKISVVADKFTLVIDAREARSRSRPTKDLELNADNGKLTLKRQRSGNHGVRCDEAERRPPSI